MTKANRQVVINACYGGFGLSPRGIKRLAELEGKPCYFYNTKGDPISIAEAEETILWHATDGQDTFKRDPRPRDDANLVKVVREMGRASRGRWAELIIVEVPHGVEWEIKEYDGIEHVAEKHRVWPKGGEN